MVEGFASSTIAGDPQTLDVTIEKSKLQRGVYRISKPYANYVSPIPALTYTDSIATPMIIHAEDPTAVWIETFKTGLSYGTTYVGGEISHQAADLLSQYTVASIKAECPEIFGTLADGIITFNPTFTLNEKTYYTFRFLFNSGAKAFATNADGKFKIMLPGSKDYSVAISADKQCSPDNKFNFTITAGKDVTKVKVATLKGDHEGIADNYNLIAQDGISLDIVDGKATYPLDLSAAKSISRYTIFAVVPNAADTAALSGEIVRVYTNDLSTTWETLPDKGTYTDAIMPFETNSADKAATYNCTVEKSTVTPGLYRFASPLADDSFTYAMINEHTSGCKHYIYLNVADTAKCYIPVSTVGFDFGYGPIAITTIPALAKADNDPEEEYSDFYGKMDPEGNVTFPAKSVLASDLNYQDGTWFYLTLAPTAFKVPGIGAGVDNVTIDANDTPVYYNLQGVRIDNPGRGLYIVKKGNTTTKVVR